MDYIDERSPLGQRVQQISQLTGVSDFYITPHEPICYKQNGSLIIDQFVYVPDQPMQVEPGCVDYAMSFAGLRFRVNRMVTRGRFRWVLRLLPSKIPTPQDIAVPAAAMKAFMEAKNGLFLVCGATGSGKSTTIASMILHRARQRDEHVVTFEDPIEYIYPSDTPSLTTSTLPWPCALPCVRPRMSFW